MTPNATSKRSSSRRRAKSVPDDSVFEGMEAMHPHSAGIDVGSEEHVVSVPPDRDSQPVRTFACTTPDLQEMALWLKGCGIEQVVMESTGVYWVPVYRVLESQGLKVFLVDAHHARGVPGRKTDVWDCRWLRKLHTFGMLNACFIPPKEIEEVRAYWRYRATLVENCAQEIQRMQKALEQMNIQLHKAVSDITGVTGMSITRAIVAGERDVQVLARMRQPGCKHSEEELVKALTGHWQPQHLFLLGQALKAYDFNQQRMRECDEKMQACMAAFSDGEPGHDADGSRGGRPSTPKPEKRRQNQPYFDLRSELARVLGVDLCLIEGIDASTAQTVYSETGGDVSAFPSAKHWSSWLGACPNHRITGGRIHSRRTRKVKNRIMTALRLAGQSLCKSNSWLGAFYRRIQARHGSPKAITATAHKLAILIYHMLRYGESYVTKAIDDYERSYQERAKRALMKRASTMGFTLVSMQTGEVIA
jgi:transposase